MHTTYEHSWQPCHPPADDSNSETDGAVSVTSPTPADGEMPGAGEARDRWGNRWSFVAAAIGSAIGLGNFWPPPQPWGEGGASFMIAVCFSH